MQSNDESIEIDIQLARMKLHGWLNNVGSSGLFYYSVHAIWINQLLGLWIKHLVLNAVSPKGIELISRWLDCEKLYSFSPVESPLKYLEELLMLYWKGLQCPLQFFPKSSYEFVKFRYKEKDIGYCLDKAMNRWCGEYNQHQESDNPYYNLAFSSVNVFDENFMNISEQIFYPLLNHLETA